MAIHDDRLEFADALPINTGAAGTYFIGDVIDLQVARDVGMGGRVFVYFTVDTTFTSGGAATVEFILASDGQAAIATDGTATVHGSTGPIPVAQLVAGKKYAMMLPVQGAIYERYLGILQKTAVAAFTAGKINAIMTLDPIGPSDLYPDAIN